MGLMFSCPIIGRFRFFSLTLVRAFLFSGWSQLLFSEVGIGEPSTEGCSGSILLSFMILGHPFAFQKHFIQFKRFLARRLAPVGFRCKPLLTSLTVLKQMRDIKRKRIFQVYFWQQKRVNCLNKCYYLFTSYSNNVYFHYQLSNSSGKLVMP